jgi:phage tail-like protein
VRGAVAGLVSPLPLVDLLPSLLQADPFAGQLCASADEVLAPVILSLDCLPAYLDVGTAPDDMLVWLGHWVALDLDDRLAPDRRRAVVAAAPELHGRRGTAGGIAQLLSVVLGLEAEVLESGATSWSTQPDADLPGEPGSTVRVRLRPPPSQQLDAQRVAALVQSVLPAHVSCHVELVNAT